MKRRHCRLLLLTIATLLLIATACSDSGDNSLLSKRQMADLLTDIHRGEAIIEYDTHDFATDSAKQLMKQSVLAKHHVTQAQLDTSLMWYGHHLEAYMEVYTIVTERLDAELKEMEISGNVDNSQVELAGDSVDVWTSNRLRRFTALQPTDNLRFTLRRDSHWEKGDVYQWKFRVNGMPLTPMRWIVSAEYTDNTVTVAHGTAAGQGWHVITFPTDSAQTPRLIHGLIEYRPTNGSAAIITDSITLTRMRIGHRGTSNVAIAPTTRYSTMR